MAPRATPADGELEDVGSAGARLLSTAVLVALTREISPALAACELTHLPRVAIDLDVARAQHREYESALAGAGCRVERLAADPALPDCVFVEDAAIAFDELALVTRPGAESRRRETTAVGDALARYRRVETIAAPATVDGGDVLVAGRRVFVGLSSRTNAEAAAQMRTYLQPLGYTVTEVAVHGCLHLKSAVTAIGDDLLLLNPDWIDPAVFTGFETIDIHPRERYAANALKIGETIVYPAAFPRTADRLAGRGLRLHLVDASELAKAEGAVTCCSIIFEERHGNDVG